MGVIIVPASGHYKNKMRHYLYFPGGSVIKKSPTKQEKQVPSLGQEDPLEREWQSTPVFLPGKSHGVYSPWGHKESGMTEPLSVFSWRTSKVRLKGLDLFCLGTQE